LRGEIGYGPRVVGRVSGPVVGEKARCYLEGTNNCGTSDLAGKAQNVECHGPLRDGWREAGNSYRKRRRGGGPICAVDW
jgi:hypothetical protein